MELDEVRMIAEEVLDSEVRQGAGAAVVVTAIYEYAQNWVVLYNTRAFWEDGSASHALAGNGPIIIDKATGQVRLGTSALAIEEQVVGARAPRWEAPRHRSALLGESQEHYLIERFVEDAIRRDGGEGFLRLLDDARLSKVARSEFTFNVVDVAVDWGQQTVEIADALAADSEIRLSLDQLMQIVSGGQR